MKDKSQSSSENEEMHDAAEESEDQAIKDDMTMNSKSTNKSGRRAIPLLWSRVISLDQVQDGAARIFDEASMGHPVDEDLEYEPEISVPKAKRRAKQWAPLFLPKHFWQDHLFTKLEQNELSKKALKA